MRLSRPRVALRAALLAAGGISMLWRAVQAHRGGPLDPANEALAARLALIWALVGVLALLAAAAAALALRPRRRAPSLRLDDLPPGPPRPRSPPGHGGARLS